MQTNKRHLGILLTVLAGALGVASASRADDKDLLKSGSSHPNVMVIISNTASMQYMPYLQGQTGNVAPDGQYQDSPVSKFGLAKSVLRAIVQANSSRFNFGLSWYSYHQESVSHKYWSYQFTSNTTIPGAQYDYPGDTFKSAVGTYHELGSSGNGPILTAGNTETFGITGTTIVPGWFGDKPAGASCTTTAVCQGYAIEKIDTSHRVAVHLVPVGGGQPYGQLSITMIKDYQLGTPAGAPTTWTTQAKTPANNAGTVSLVLSASVATTGLPNTFTTGADNGLYMGFMRSGDWSLNTDCGGWFVQNSLPAIGIPRDYNSDLSCSLTTCAQPPEQSVGCVFRYTRPQSAVIHYVPGANATSGPLSYPPSNPPDDTPGLCSSSVVHTGAGPEDQVVLMGDNTNHIPEDKMFANADSYFSGSDCFVNGARSDDPNKTCRTGAIILLSDTFQACGPHCSQNAVSKYLVALKGHHVPVYVINLGVPDAQAAEAHCIATTSGSEDATHQGVFAVTSTTPAQVASDLTDAFTAILTRIDEATVDFASASVSSVQAGNGQMAFLTTFNARKNRSIWDGALRGYKLLPNGAINPAPVAPDTHAQNLDGSDCVSTVKDPNDPQLNVVLDVPCNQFPTLRWNAAINLSTVPLVPSNPSGVADLAAGATLTTGATYSDTTNDGTGHNIPIFNYSGRHILWSLPSTVATAGFPSTLPINLPINGATAAGTEPVPETSEPFLVPSSSYWTDTGFKFLKLLMTSQTAPPASGTQPAACVGIACPSASDISASQTVRFIRGDRDTVINELRVAAGSAVFPSGDPHYYASPNGALKLGDIFHSNPLLLAEPENVFYFNANLHNYGAFFTNHQHRRRVLYTGANDGLLHAFDVGVWNRTTTDCTGGLTNCYDFGTGAELFAYMPRAIAQALPRLKNVVGAQDKTDEWTVDGAPAAADMFIDTNHSGTPVSGNRAWHTILVGTMREGSAFEGQTPCPSTTTTAFQNSASSVYALDVTQPEPSVVAGGDESLGSFASPGCLDGVTLDSKCPARWPKVLWEIQDTTDADSNGYPDMGEGWSKPGLGHICVAKDGSGNCTDERYIALFGGGFDRERKNRRGNWFYIVDVETGFVLYKVNSGIANLTGSNVTVNFASIPAGPTAIDVNNDGLLDFVYFGDMLGQMWRLDLRDLKVPSSPTTRWSSKLQKGDGSALSPFLVFQAPQPVSTTTPPNQYFPIYYQPAVVYLGVTTPGQPLVGLAFGTGDRDDITAKCDTSTSSTSYNQRFYFVVDNANTTTVTESSTGMLKIATSSTANTTTVPAAGWYLLMGTSSATAGERQITDVLVVNQFIYFFTATPTSSATTGVTCPPPTTCTVGGTLPRAYTMFYANGNYPVGASDRAVTVPNASFASNPVFYVSGDQHGNVGYTTNHGGFNRNPNVQPTQSSIKAWKEN